MSRLKFLKSPSLLLVILFTSFTIVSVILNSCKRTSDKGEYPNDSLLKALQRPVVLSPTEKEIQQLVEMVKPQSEQLISSINKNYPGLYKKYEAAVKELARLTKKEEIKRATDNLDAAYKKSFMDAYVKSGIEGTLLDTYKKTLSKYEYKVGDLGTIVIINRQKGMGDIIPEPKPIEILYSLNLFALMGCNGASSVTFKCPFDIREKNSNCQSIAIDDLTYVSDCSCIAGNVNFLIGGCGSFSKLGKNIDVNGAALNIITIFTADYSLNATAYAILGGSYCQASVGSEIYEGSILKQKNEFSKVWAVAPVIWYAQSVEELTNQNMFCSYNRTATPGSFTITAKIYCEASAGAGLFAGCVPHSSIRNISSLKVQMLQ